MASMSRQNRPIHAVPSACSSRLPPAGWGGPGGPPLGSVLVAGDRGAAVEVHFGGRGPALHPPHPYGGPKRDDVSLVAQGTPAAGPVRARVSPRAGARREGRVLLVRVPIFVRGVRLPSRRVARRPIVRPPATVCRWPYAFAGQGPGAIPRNTPAFDWDSGVYFDSDVLSYGPRRVRD